MLKRNSRQCRPSAGPWPSFTARTPLGSPLSRSESRLRLVRPREHWRQAGLVLATLLTLAAPFTLRSPADPGPTLRSGEGLPLAVTAGRSGRTASAVERADRAAQEESEPLAAPRVLARFGEVDLVTMNREVQLVGFHEASYADALPLAPIGRMVFNDNPTKFAPYSLEEGPDFVVLSSRGRPNAATSAVDMVLPVGVPVASVVTGRISLIEPYLLYGRYPDTKIEIIPEARPDLRVVMIHLRDVRAVAGQHVVGGETIIAGSANQFPFSSQVDRYLGHAAPGPHVHIEVKAPAGDPLPPPDGPPPPPT